jgi:hypothetical protein
MCAIVAALCTLAPGTRALATVYTGCVSVSNTSGVDAVLRLDAYPGYSWKYAATDTGIDYLTAGGNIVKLTTDMAKPMPAHVEPSSRLTLLNNFFSGGTDPNCGDSWRFVITIRPELLGH